MTISLYLVIRNSTINYELEEITMDETMFNSFQWLNKSEIRFEADKMVIYAPAASDFFCNNGAISEEGITPASLQNAPFFYTEVEGDFVMKVQVSHAFKDTYDSATIMIMHDLNIWAKACFEKTDFDTHAVVSVVTNHTSDDANGCNIAGNEVWLQVARVGNSFAFHYSEDGSHFYMMRFFNLPVKASIRAGLIAQAPQGNGGERYYKNFSIEKKTVKNIRMGK
jgi:regulation of enolase protein 1 (concanavalin A-like superfamily)